VAIQVHCHGGRSMTQHALYDLGIRPSSKPDRRRSVSQVVFADADRRLGKRVGFTPQQQASRPGATLRPRQLPHLPTSGHASFHPEFRGGCPTLRKQGHAAQSRRLHLPPKGELLDGGSRS